MFLMGLLSAEQGFFDKQNNIYILVAAAVAVLAILVIVLVSLPRKKKGEETVTAEDKPNQTEQEAVAQEVAAGAEAVALDTETESELKLVPMGAAVVPEKPAAAKTDKATEVAVEKPGAKKAEKPIDAEEVEPAAKTSKPTVKKADKATEVAVEKPAAKKAENPIDAEEVEPAAKTSKPTVKKADKATDVVAEKPVAKKAALKSAEPVEVLDEDLAGSAPVDGEITEEDGKESRPGTVEIYKDKQGAFHFRFRAMNGSIVGHSQAYKAKESCKNGIRSVIATCEDAEIVDTTKKDSDYLPTIGKAVFEIYKDTIGQFRFRLLAKNATNILASQGYVAKTSCLNGAESIVRMSKNHTVVDSTLRRKSTGV